jgi:hypothetical protein
MRDLRRFHCKKCAQFVEPHEYLLMRNVPEDLTHGAYCGPCYDVKIHPLLADYRETVERARGVFVFYTDDANETRLFKRESKVITVDHCADNEDVLMTLAYLAVRAGYNALIDVEVATVKVDLNGYQTSRWSGRGLPVKLHDYIPNRKSRYIGNCYKR